MQARHVRYSSGFVWITHGWYEDGWWRNGSVDCTGEQLETYLDRAIGVTHYPTTDEGIPGVSFIHIGVGWGGVIIL